MRLDFGELHVVITVVDPAVLVALARIESKLDAAVRQETKEMAAIDDAIEGLKTKLADNTSATASIKALVSSIPQMIADAVAKAIAAGATPAEVQAVVDLGNALKANTDELVASVVAGTPIAATP